MHTKELANYIKIYWSVDIFSKIFLSYNEKCCWQRSMVS